MKFIVKLFPILALVAFLSTGCKEDETPTLEVVAVSGTVTDDTGKALEGATITSSTEETVTASTDANGLYTISISKDSDLIFSKDGYVSTEEPVSGTEATETVNAELARGPGAFFAATFEEAGNQVTDPGFGATDIIPSNDLGTGSAEPSTMVNVNFKGAVDPASTPWYAEWSFYDNLIHGTTTSDAITTGTVEVWTDADMIAAGNDVQWTNDKTYVLDGFVFVSDGQTLTIQEGTVVQGKSGEGDNASALIISRGGKIMANGTKEFPIIFTYEGDNGNSSAELRGQWGGLIILGKAGLNSTPGETAVEGLPTSEPRGLYGGNDDDDNSGVLRYVSIRHGGTNIGADNEINGMTLGGVGRGTTIEYVEIIGNKDDGIEWFGGTVTARYLISAFCADDGLDYDEGFRGENQFVIVHQDPSADAADRGGEHDGGTDPETGTPYATPLFYNVTSIGNPDSRTITFRDNAGGEYHNSIFVNYKRGIDIEDLVGQDQDSYKQWEDGILKIENCVFFNIGAGNRDEDIFKVSSVE
ncbi:MAG: carboxypeptidase regulatory-like domain-containing protein [Saprospiraceae bacterium]|nr:carboxypeptidase regulatory-like domain-containing protein [Saprospiraceae bacterium]